MTDKRPIEELDDDALEAVSGGLAQTQQSWIRRGDLGGISGQNVVTDGVEWTRTGYGEDPIKGPRDCD